MPRWPDKKGTDAVELTGDTETSLVLPGQGDGEIKRTDLSPIEAENAGPDKDRLDSLQMAEEMIDVMVHESTDPNADNPVMVYCNGVSQFFIRGQTQKVRRKYVEVLARAKQEAVRTTERREQGDTVITKTRSLRYPFSVQYDPNPKGQQWLRNILAQP